MTTLTMPCPADVTAPVTSSAISRRRGGKTKTATRTGRLAIVACLDLGDDALEVLLRDDLFAGTLAQAKRHAAKLARTLADRRHASVSVQVLDRDTGDLLHDELAVASLGEVAESIAPVNDDVRRVILAGIAAGLTEAQVARQLRGCA